MPKVRARVRLVTVLPYGCRQARERFEMGATLRKLAAALAAWAAGDGLDAETEELHYELLYGGAA